MASIWSRKVNTTESNNLSRLVPSILILLVFSFVNSTSIHSIHPLYIHPTILTLAIQSHPTPHKMHQSQAFFLTLVTLIFQIQSRPDLYPSDYNALLHIHKAFAIPLPTNLCNSTRISCKPIIADGFPILRVTRLVFQSQHLTGKISPAIGDLSELQELSLPNNQITDRIPSQITHCQKLQILNLRNNQFSSDVPTELSTLIHLQILDLSSNKLSGTLEFLQSLTNLVKLNLADNKFTGQAPASSFSQNLRYINLSGNSLLKVSMPGPWMADHYNHDFPSELAEEDSFPRRYVFAESSQGRNQSISAMAPSPGAEPNSKNKSKKKKAVEWILRFLSGILAGGLSGLVFCLLIVLIRMLVRGRIRHSRLRIFSPMIKKPKDLAFLEKEDGLASLQIIGRGGCGEVYKTTLPGSNGKEIAIKKIIPFPTYPGETSDEDSKLLRRRMKQIWSEIQTVGQIRHRNLVPLLAHLPQPNCHYLVYEYMKNGSLQDYLKLVADGKRELDWLARHRIAIGLASGLEYLHMYHKPRIIHRDLKPANVLLDDEMEARIADFGLATAVPDSNTHVTTSNVAGTVGYIAPEYYQTFQFTDKCDIYSFGVVLGVLVIGRMPSDDFFQQTDEVSMVEWMRNVMTSEDPRRAIDRTLLGNGYDEQMLLVLKIACFCTVENPTERPTSRDVRSMLSQITH